MILIVGLVLLSACGADESGEAVDGATVVVTIPPFEMILRRLVEGRGKVERLLEPGASPHTYDPTPSDLRATTNATLLVYGADHLDGWAAELPASRRLALLGLVPSADRLFFDHGGTHSTVDPHFWTDPRVVKKMVPVLADTLCAVDPRGCSTYRANADSFATRLTVLDTQLRTLTSPIRDTPVLLAQPFFRYFLHQYGPRLDGVIEPRPGAEATPRQLRRLIEQARTAGVRAILTQRSLSDRAARAVSEASQRPLIVLDPLGGTEGRRTYEELMRTNAQLLHDSLVTVEMR